MLQMDITNEIANKYNMETKDRQWLKMIMEEYYQQQKELDKYKQKMKGEQNE